MFFLDNLVEDGVDGSSFDCDVLDALKAIETKHEHTTPGVG